MRKFYQFLILPELSESSFVNLGLASGLIGNALQLDVPETPIIPSTCQSSFTFQFKAHTLFSNTFNFENGQVEIDSVFIEKRNGQDTLFLIEAKRSKASLNSLAKHKLVYPLLSLYPKIPHDMPIVPVYIKVKKIEEGIMYDIAECQFPDPRKELGAIDQLTVKKSSRFFLPVQFK